MNFFKKNIVEKLFWLMIIILVIFAVWMAFTIKPQVDSNEENTSYQVFNGYEVEEINDQSAPQKIRQRFTFTPDMKSTTFNHLVFHTTHQEVEVYLEGNLIYSLKSSNGKMFGNTPGDVWNMIQIKAENVGKVITVDIIPIYSQVENQLPIIYFGDRYSIVMHNIMTSIPLLLICFALLVIGVIYIFFVSYTYKRGALDNKVAYLGIFAILTGIWKLADTEVITMIFIPNGLVTAYISMFAMMLQCIPYCLYICNKHNSREHWLWKVPQIFAIGTIVVMLVLQFTNLMDLRETQFLSYLAIFLTLAVHLIMIIRDVRENGMNPSLKMRIIAAATIPVGVVADIVIYYFTGMRNILIFSLIGVTFYVIMLVLESIREMRTLVNIGQETRKLEDLAYHDKLTGLYNRTAYAEDTQAENVRPEHMIVIVCDLNNLKFCNDNFGHEQGDLYITTCARLIKESFKDIGKCYRIGGDEFCVLITGQSIATCKIRLHNLEEMLSEVNTQRLIDMKMQIAYGYVAYDKDVDFDIQDTIRRADRLMYQDKFNKKQWL